MRKRTQPHLITGASISREKEFKSRQKRYFFTMLFRIVLLVIAAIVARYSIFAAIGVGVLSVVLPWFAVVMANDGPPKSSKYYRRVTPTGQHERALAAGTGESGNNDQRIILAESVIIDEHGATPRDDERGNHEQH